MICPMVTYTNQKTGEKARFSNQSFARRLGPEWVLGDFEVKPKGKPGPKKKAAPAPVEPEPVTEPDQDK